MSTATVETSTRKAGRHYRVKVCRDGLTLGVYQVQLCDDPSKGFNEPHVWVYTATASAGYYLLARFGGQLSAGTVRDFFLTAFNTEGTEA